MEENLRVLHVVTYMGRGGLETMIMNYYRNIDRNKIQFDFLVHRDFEADYDQEIQKLGGRIYRLPRLNPVDAKYLRKLNQFFREHKEYQVVHSHLDCMAGIPLKYAKKNGVPVRIAHAHSSSQTKDGKYFLKLFYKKGIKMNTTHLFACGKDAGQWMFGEEKFEILNNAIDAKKYIVNYEEGKKIRQEFEIPLNSLVIGHVGRFNTPKNHAFILRVFAEVIKRESDAFLLLVGEGNLREEIQKQTKELGIQKNVIFTGLRTDVPQLLQAMDVFLFPSLYEGLPVSVIEAQAAGVPCLISDKVPIECKKTDLVRQISLNGNPNVWCEEVLHASRLEKRNTYYEIAASGFDICENAKWLENFYLEQVKGK